MPFCDARKVAGHWTAKPQTRHQKQHPSKSISNTPFNCDLFFDFDHHHFAIYSFLVFQSTKNSRFYCETVHRFQWTWFTMALLHRWCNTMIFLTLVLPPSVVRASILSYQFAGIKRKNAHKQNSLTLQKTQRDT